MKLYIYCFLSCLSLCFISACAPTYYNPIVVRPASCSKTMQFAESPDLSYVLAFADKMEKPVFLDFYAPWIPSCTRMDETVFTQGLLASFFNQNFINYKVNADDRLYYKATNEGGFRKTGLAKLANINAYI